MFPRGERHINLILHQNITSDRILENVFHPFHVYLDLGDERVHTLETLLVPYPLHELEPESFTVDIGTKVEYMGLDEQLAAPEGRSVAYVRYTVQSIAVYISPRGIDPCFRQYVPVRVQVRGGVSDLSPPLFPLGDLSLDIIKVPQEPGRLFCVARLEDVPDSGTADDLVVYEYRSDDGCFEVVRFTHGLEKVGISFPLSSE